MTPLGETIQRIKLNQDSQQFMKRGSQLSGNRHQSVRNKRESLDSNAFMIDFNTLIFDDNVVRPSKKKRESGISSSIIQKDNLSSTETFKVKQRRYSSIGYEEPNLV